MRSRNIRCLCSHWFSAFVGLTAGIALIDFLGAAPYRSCTFQVSTWDGFLRGARTCWRNPSSYSFLSSPHSVAAALLTYWSVLLALHLALRGQRASFAWSRLFLFLAGVHNALLAIVSLSMCAGITLALVQVALGPDGVRGTLCTPPGSRVPLNIEWWLYVFYLSKFWEFFDTVLLVLRGRPVTLLHLWHHSSTAIYTHAWLDYGMTLGAYGMWFNSLIHVFMYSYYLCRLFKLSFPFKKLITVTQIVQFLTSFAFIVPFVRYNNLGAGCTGKYAMFLSAFLNLSYLVLFVRFYFAAYSGSPDSKIRKD